MCIPFYIQTSMKWWTFFKLTTQKERERKKKNEVKINDIYCRFVHVASYYADYCATTCDSTFRMWSGLKYVFYHLFACMQFAVSLSILTIKQVKSQHYMKHRHRIWCDSATTTFLKIPFWYLNPRLFDKFPLYSRVRKLPTGPTSYSIARKLNVLSGYFVQNFTTFYVH